MEIEQIYTGCLAEAAYYIESNGEAAIIDPLRETGPYIEKAKARGAKIKYIFETHFHADFVSGHVDLARKTGAQIVYGPGAKTNYAIHEAKDGEIFKLGNITIKVLHTPGHTPESSTYLLKDEKGEDHAIFTGDTLFIGDVGRPDLAIKKGNITKEDLAGMLYDSLRNKIMPLRDEVLVYPAHGAGSACGKNMSSETWSTLGEQKKSNYALQEMTKEEFIEQVTEGILPPPQYFSKNAMLNKSGYDSIDEVMKRGMMPLSPEAVEKEMKNGAVMLDARSPQTFNKAFVPGSVNIGLDGSFAVWVGTLMLDLNQPIVVIADAGREEEVVMRLARVGYDNAKGYLEGGLEAWKAAKKPTDSIESIPAKELENRLRTDNIHLLDVRKPAEYDEDHVAVAESFPLDYINEAIAKLDKNQMYHLHCKTGYRSMVACSILKSKGFKHLINVAGGIEAIRETDIQRTASQGVA